METTNIKIDSEVMNGFKLFYEEHEELKEAGLSVEDFVSHILNQVLVDYDEGTGNLLENFMNFSI